MAKLEYAAVHAADVATVFPILTAEEFLDDYARELGAAAWSIAVTPASTTVTTQVDLRAPTDNIPAQFRRFVGPHVDISEERTWRAAEPDGTRRGRLRARAVVGGRDASVRGTLLLSPEDDAVRFAVNADIHVRLGLLSQLAAAKLGDFLTGVLHDQTIVLDRWLTTAGS